MKRKPAFSGLGSQGESEMPIYRETVAFIDSELGADLVASFAIEDPADRTEIRSLTLLRMPKYENVLDPEERGVTVSFERYLDDDDRRDLLKLVRFSKEEKTMHLETTFHWYDLDLRKTEAQELMQMRKVLRQMNRDGRFRLDGL